MKRKYFFAPLLLLVPFLGSCNSNTLKVEVSSNRNFPTDYEIVELDSNDITSRLNLNGETFIITDGEGQEVHYQLTYDGKVIFPATVAANSTSTYTISKGIPSDVTTLATGRFYPERHDDMAWENDKIGFRVYGPESERRGDRLYGNDIFIKRDTSEPILERLYALNQSKEIAAQIDSLKKSGNKEEAKRLSQAKSYHIDHGNGMDCYAVGPTLGAGTTAIISNDTIAYPWCFESYEVLDNGPLRFTVSLTYPSQQISGDQVVEHRTITLDAGNHLNRTTVTYDGLNNGSQNSASGSGNANSPVPVITGIVIHEGSEQASCEASNRYIAYTDPTQGDDNGEIYIGAAFIEEPDFAGITTHDDIRHVAAINHLDQDNKFTYYWGAGWNRSDIPSWDQWLDYLDTSVKKITSPLTVNVK